MAQDILNIKIEEDGTVTIESPGAISQTNHVAAANFVKTVKTLLGGDSTTVKTAHGHHHTHDHEHGGLHHKH